MAVPFSRPSYSQSPRHQATQPQQPVRSEQQVLVDQLISGRLPVNLNNMSFRTRLVIYALTEALRLLRDLMNSHNHNHNNSIDNDTAPTSTRTSPCDSASSVMTEAPVPSQKPDLITSNDDHETEEDDFAAKAPHHHLGVTPAGVEHSVSDFCHHVLTKSDCTHLSDLAMPDIIADLDNLKTTSSPWRGLGHQLCQLASAFELCYAGPGLKERLAHAAFQRIKLSILPDPDNEDDDILKDSPVGLAKVLAKQMLLSGIWVLLKQVM